MVGPASPSRESRETSQVECVYDVGALPTVRDLTGVAGIGSVALNHEQLLETVYVDTADLRLRTAGSTLRHGAGGADPGWHLVLSAGADREELTVDGSGDRVPDELAGLVRAQARGRELRPVARLRTQRSAWCLLDPQGAPLAELADSRVTGRLLPEGSEQQWRAWELELLGGDRALLDTVRTRLEAAGAVLSRPASELVRLVGSPAVDAQPPRWSEPARDPGRPSAGDVVQTHLAEQVAELVTRDPQVRRGRPDAVHKMRVATRRLRSALTTFGPMLDRGQTDTVRGELQWLAQALGGVRDAEVMHARLRELVSAEPPELVLGAVQARIDQVLLGRQQAAQTRLVEALDGERYLRLLETLDALVVAPPFLERAHGEAHEVLARLLRRTWRRLHRAMVRAQRARGGSERDELLHQVRKDAKRARYAAEAVQPVFGRPAARFAAAMEGVQESLGNFHDGVVTGELLRELGARGHLRGENGFTLGRLHAQEQVRAELAVQRWPAARAAVSRRRLRRWFRD